MARADIHVFGSRSGYETLAASPRLREDEIRALAIFQFGEAATSDAIARLESVAVMSGRPLASGRFAISRMLPAGTDDAGRPTIEVISLIIDAAGYEACAGSLMMLAHDVDFWRSARAAVTTGIEIPDCAPPSTPSDPSLLGAYDLWFAAVRDGGIGVMRESESATILEFVCTLDPRDRAKCRWGIGLLSISTPADIASIDSGTSTRGVRNVIRPAQEGSWLCEKMDYVQFRARSTARYFVASDELLLAAHVPAELGGFAQDARTVRVSVHSKDARTKSVTLVAIGSALLSTFVMALGVSAYAGMWKHPVQLMPPIPSGSGGVGAHEEVAPGNRGSKYTGNKQNTTAPVLETPPAESTPTPPPVEPPPVAPEIDPSMVDRDGDGKVGADDECPDERTLTKQIEYFADTDADGKGDPNAHVKSCSTKPTPGYVTNGDDQCPTNPKKIAEGECGCLCDFDGVDADDDGQIDCLQAPEGNFVKGTQNRDLPDWEPDLEGGKSIRDMRVGFTTFSEGVAEIRLELELSKPSLSLEEYQSLLTTQLTRLNVLGGDLFQLQKEQCRLSKDPKNEKTVHGFAKSLWPAVKIKGSNPTSKIQGQWVLILSDLIVIADAIEARRLQFMSVAQKFPEKGTGSNSDRTRGDVERSVDRRFNDAKDALKGTSQVLLNRQKLENELTGLEEEPEAPP